MKVFFTQNSKFSSCQKSFKTFSSNCVVFCFFFFISCRTSLEWCLSFASVTIAAFGHRHRDILRSTELQISLTLARRHSHHSRTSWLISILLLLIIIIIVTYFIHTYIRIWIYIEVYVGHNSINAMRRRRLGICGYR